MLTDLHKNTDLAEGIEYFLPKKFRQIRSTVADEKSKTTARGVWACLFMDPYDNKTTSNFVEDVEYLLPVKFHQVPCSGLRGVVKMPYPITGQGDHLC